MKEKLNISRILSLLYCYWTENKTVLLLLITLSLPTVYFTEIGNGRIQIGSGFFTGALSVILMLFLVVAFRCVDKKERTAYFFMLPASQLEKFLFIILAGIFLPYLLILIDLFLVKGFMHFVPLEFGRSSGDISKVTDFNSIKTFLSTSSVLMLLVTIRYISKNTTIIRSLFVLIGGALILSLIDSLIVKFWFGNYIDSTPFGKMKFEIGDKALISNGLYVDFLPYSMVLLACLWVAILYLAFSKFRVMEKGL